MVRWYVTINLASIKSKRIKLRIKLNHSIPILNHSIPILNHSIPILNPHFICINITIFSGVYLIDFHLLTKMVPVHFTIILKVMCM